MGLTIFSKFFHKKKHNQTYLDIPLVSLIEDYAKTKEYFFFKDLTIYHRSNSIYIPVMLFIPEIGIVLFSIKEWHYQDLLTSTLKKSAYLNDDENTLAFDNIQRFINEKLLDIAQIENINFINFAILPELTSKEYQLLNDSIKNLLPQEKILFDKDTIEEIEKKLSALKTHTETYNPYKILPYLCSEYMIIHHQNISFANKDQRKFIDTSLNQIENISAQRLSGKSHTILLKALKEKLHNPELKIAIVVPTKLHIYLLKQLLLQLIEKSCIMLDMDEFLFFTQPELLKFHAHKINKEIVSYTKVDPILFKKDIFLADLVLCDDAHTFNDEFIAYLQHIQKKHSLCFINAKEIPPTYIFNTSYQTNHVEFHPHNTSSHLLRELYTLLKQKENPSILIFTEIDEDSSLAEDITSFTGIQADFIDIEEPQNIISSQIQIAPLTNTIPLRADYIFILTSDNTNLSNLTYLLDASKKTTFILYNEDNENIKQFQKDFNGQSDKN